MFYFLLLKIYATANNPTIADIASNPGGVGVDVGFGVGVVSGLGIKYIVAEDSYFFPDSSE